MITAYREDKQISEMLIDVIKSRLNSQKNINILNMKLMSLMLRCFSPEFFVTAIQITCFLKIFIVFQLIVVLWVCSGSGSLQLSTDTNLLTLNKFMLTDVLVPSHPRCRCSCLFHFLPIMAMSRNWKITLYVWSKLFLSHFAECSDLVPISKSHKCWKNPPTVPVQDWDWPLLYIGMLIH